jgi:outer membrane protein insertion porin family
LSGFIRSFLVSVAVALLVATGSLAFAQEGGVIHEIVVQGNQRIEPETVRSYMSIAEGDPFDDAKIDKSLKSLFATGLFADVSIRRDGSNLVVRVVENPIINRVAFEGNHRVKTDQLQTEVQLKPRTVYTRTKVQNDVKRILDIYRRNGRFAATVDPKIIELPQNRVDLVFEINEGPATYVTRINFIGNRRYSDSALREILQTKEERWYRFLSSDDTYDPDRLNYDRELMRRFYLHNGFADFRVVSTAAELSPDREKFFITFTIEEGDRYKVGKVDVKSSIRDLKAEELLPAIDNIETGDWYNADEIENTIQHLTDVVGTKGYAFVDIKPIFARHRDTHTIDVTFDVQEGPRVFVERIDIQGNVRTLDKVIRREFRLVEGDAFNAAKLRRSRQRLKDLDFFEKAEVNTVPSSTAPDRTVIKVDVQEKSTGEISFGVGWSSAVGPLLNVGLRERNLLGTGRDINLQTQLAEKQSTVSLGFTEPYFLDRRIAAGFDFFLIKTDPNLSLVYAASTAGFDLRAGYYYNEYLSHNFRYTASMTNVHDIQPGASQYIFDQEGVTTLSSIGHTLLYDRRDSKVDPTTGYYLRFGNELAGVGGSQHFLRNSFGAGHYFPVGDQSVLLLATNGGYIFGLKGDQVRINERYYLGGDTLRGFKDAGVSPRDPSTGDALGGLWEATATAELKFPLGLPKELGVQGKLFTDVGTIGQTDPSVARNAVNENTSPRITVGTGLVWRSPMGPINIDLGFPIVRQSGDQMQIFRLNFGTRF